MTNTASSTGSQSEAFRQGLRELGRIEGQNIQIEYRYIKMRRIADLALKHRLPYMSEASEYVEAGSLMSYAGDNDELFRRAATYVDKILKGAKPAELPVEQASNFDGHQSKNGQADRSNHSTRCACTGGYGDEVID